MFFIVFVLFFSQYFPTDSLKCMSGSGNPKLPLTKCEFSLDIGQSIFSNEELTKGASLCAMQVADIGVKILKIAGSCYAEVQIDYNKKKMTIYSTHVFAAASALSPYDDMFGFINGIKSVVQYKINGNLEKERMKMTTRIQCDTADNCALNKLRALIPNLTIVDARKNIFKELKNFLNPSNSNPSSSQLTCMDNDDQQIECQNDQNRCLLDHNKSGIGKDCAVADANADFDLEYRFNLVEEISNTGDDNSARTFKMFYQCKADLCNSEDNFVRVDKMLNALAMGSGIQTQDATNNNNPSAQKGRSKSDGVSLSISFTCRLMILFLLSIQF